MEVPGRKDSDTQVSVGENTDYVFCQPCRSEGDNVPAESYCVTCSEFICSSCLRAHRKLSLTKNHVIKSKDEMPQEQTQKDPCSELCATHETEIIKFYCQGHNEVGCADCMILEHKVCKVQLVPNVSSINGNSDELSKIKLKIDHLMKEIASRKQELKSTFKATAEMTMKVVEDIKKFRKDINSYLDHAEAELLMEVEQLKDKDEALQKNLQDECVSLETDIKDIQNELETHSDKVNQLFVAAKIAQKRLQICQQSIERIGTECQIHDYEFEPSKELMTLKENNSSIGSITIQFQKDTRPRQSKENKVEMKAEFVNKLNIKAAKDGDCWIMGLAKISCDEILLADRNNKCLKLFNVRKCKITSRYSSQPPTEPWEVTVINADTAAATLPELGKIVFVNSKSGLAERHSLKVRTNCSGIDHKNGIIAVSFDSPSALKILNTKGNVLHEFSESGIFAWPRHLAFSYDGRKIFVSDFERHTLYELTTDAHLVDTMKLKGKSFPRGLGVTRDGNVIICCEGNNDSISIMIPKTREMRPLVLKHVKHPTAIVVCEKQNKIFISDASEDRNYIKTYDIK